MFKRWPHHGRSILLMLKINFTFTLLVKLKLTYHLCHRHFVQNSGQFTDIDFSCCFQVHVCVVMSDAYIRLAVIRVKVRQNSGILFK